MAASSTLITIDLIPSSSGYPLVSRIDTITDNPLWGDGWGWALYKPNDRGKNVATNYKVDCLGCHVPAKDKDWVYTEAYPTLSPEQ